MESARSGLVDIVREYLDVYEQLGALFAHYRQGDLDFESVRQLCDDTDASPLFRLKERCHALFRNHDPAELGAMRREALFDLAVGSLFHETMKFRENFYQKVVYSPKVEALRDQQGPGTDDLFREFEKILAGSAVRIQEALQESEALLGHTAEQLRRLIKGRRDGLLTRYLIEQRERLEGLMGQPLDVLLSELHGSALEAHVAAAGSYLDSAHFAHALAALEEARRLAGGRDDLQRRICYATGMSAFMQGEYGASLDALEAWLDASPGRDEQAFLSLAHSAISRIERLLKADEEGELIGRAAALAVRIEPLLGERSSREHRPAS